MQDPRRSGGGRLFHVFVKIRHQVAKLVFQGPPAEEL